MNKQHLKRYMNNKKIPKEQLKINCFKYKDKYFISDSYSIIVLNDNYNLNVEKDIFNLSGQLENFENNYKVNYTFFEIPKDNKDMYEPIDKGYGINIRLFKRIRNVINANSYAILEKDSNYDYMPIIKLENTKTKEIAYMLPMRNF